MDTYQELVIQESLASQLATAANQLRKDAIEKYLSDIPDTFLESFEWNILHFVGFNVGCYWVSAIPISEKAKQWISIADRDSSTHYFVYQKLIEKFPYLSNVCMGFNTDKFEAKLSLATPEAVRAASKIGII